MEIEIKCEHIEPCVWYERKDDRRRFGWVTVSKDGLVRVVTRRVDSDCDWFPIRGDSREIEARLHRLKPHFARVASDLADNGPFSGRLALDSAQDDATRASRKAIRDEFRQTPKPSNEEFEQASNRVQQILSEREDDAALSVDEVSELMALYNIQRAYSAPWLALVDALKPHQLI